MSQQWMPARLLQEHFEAIQRHRRYISTHEGIIRVLQALERQAITEDEAISQLEAMAGSLDEPGLVAIHRQTIERLLQRGRR